MIKNLGNLLNDDWGIVKQGNYIGDGIVDVEFNDDNSFVYSNVQTPVTARFQAQSLWEIRIGVRYRF